MELALCAVNPGESYYRARYYDPTSGRFISEDPIGFSSGLNFYPYVHNIPTGWRDPSGKCFEGIDTIICIIAVAGGAGIYASYLNFTSSLENLKNLRYNHAMALQDAIKKCSDQSGGSPEACQAAINLAAETECKLLRGAQHSAFAGLALPGTFVGGDYPLNTRDLVNSALQDQITQQAEREFKKAEKNSDKNGCGCQK